MGESEIVLIINSFLAAFENHENFQTSLHVYFSKNLVDENI